MGYVIGPDGKIYDDGNNHFARQPIMSEEQIAADMANLGKEPTVDFSEAIIESPGYAPGVASVEPEQRVIGPDGQILRTVDPYNYDSVVNLVGKDAYDKATAEYKRKNTLAEPFPQEAGRATASKVKYSESGPVGIENVPGNADPYNQVFGTGSEDLMQARGMLRDAAITSEDALSLQDEANAQYADINKREFEAQGKHAELQQAELTKGQENLEKRRIERERLAQQAKIDAVKRVEAWDREAKQAAETEVDPNRYWNNRSSFNKIAFALGALAGGMRTDGGPNTALEMLQTSIGRDIAAQSDKMERKMKYLTDKRGNIDLLNNLDRLGIEDFDQATTDWVKEFDIRLQVVNKEIDKIVAKYGAERVNPQLLELQAQTLQGRANIRQAYGKILYDDANAKIDREFKANEAAKNRRHDAAMANQRRAWEVEDRDAQIAAAQAEAETKGVVTTEQMGIFTGDQGKIRLNPTLANNPGAMTEFITKGSDLNAAYRALNLAHDVLSNRTMVDKILASTDQAAALMSAVNETAKASGLKPMSDSDINRVTEIVTGGKGNFWELVKKGNALGPIKAAINKNLEDGKILAQAYSHPDTPAEYRPENTYKKPGAADTGADEEAYLAELSGGTTPNRAKEKPEQRAATEVIEYEQAKTVVKKFAEKKDVDGLQRYYNTVTDKMAEAAEKGLRFDPDLNKIADEIAQAIEKINAAGQKPTNSEIIEMEKYYRDGSGPDYPTDY